MKVKSYYAETVEAAMARARQEMGEEAMLLASRRSAPEARHLGEYEVIFAAAAENGFRQELARASESAPAPGVDRLVSEVADLRRQLERTASAFQRAGALTALTVNGGAGTFQLFSSLIAAGVDAELAHSLIATVRQSSPSDPGDGIVAETVRREITRLIVTNSELGVPGSTPRIVALVGPPGAGKTTTLIKLAIRNGIALRKRIHFVSLDTCRVGGSDQLRTYASIAGASMDLVDSQTSLTQSLEVNRTKDLILIDTPGLDSSREDLRLELARWIGAQHAIDVHLVLPASARSDALRKMASAHESFRPVKLIFTRLDELCSFGSLLNQCLWGGKPISFLSGGQSIPEDLRPAGASEIAGLILGDGLSQVAAAAA